MKKSLIATLCGVLLLNSLTFLTLNNSRFDQNVYAASSSSIPDGYTAVYSIEDLYSIRSNPSGNFIMMNDIDLADTAEGGDWDNGNGWVSIPSFSGVLDGNGYKIENMNIYGQVSQSGFIINNYGTIKNLNFANVNVEINNSESSVKYGTICTYTGSKIVRGYPDKRYSGSVENCSVKGTISIKSKENATVGGLVGLMSNVGGSLDKNVSAGHLNSSFNSADIIVNSIEAKGSVGGLVGYEGYNYTFSSSSNIGGTSSNTTYYRATISNCYNAGNINSNTQSGGIVGLQGGNIENCFNYTDGAIYGSSNALSSTTPVNCFYKRNNTFGLGGSPLSLALMKQASSFTNYDFNDVWEMSPDGTHPQIINNREIVVDNIVINQHPTFTVFDRYDEFKVDGTVNLYCSSGINNTIPITIGMVTGYDMSKNGRQVLTITYMDVTTEYFIKVGKIPAEGINLSKNDISLVTGEVYDALVVSVIPDYADEATVEWFSNDDSIATVDDDGNITAISPGTTEIVAIANGILTDSCTVTVTDPVILPISIKLDKSNLQLEVSESYTLAATIKPASSTNKSITWTTSNAKVATVANGKITAISPGSATITVKTVNGKAASCIVKVNAKVVSNLTNTSWVNAEKVQIGDDIRVTGGAEGGSGGYTYAYYFKRSVNTKWNKIGTEFGTASYAITIPKAATDYDMKVVVKDSEGNTAEKIFKVTAVESLPLTNISLINTPATISTGKTVTLAGRCVGGTKPVKYEFYFKRSANTKWNKLSYGNEKQTYAKFTPTKAAEYDLKAVAIDKNGTKSEKIYNITAN